MTQTNVNVQMQIRRDTAANWSSTNPVLLAGEWGYVTDTGKFKIGNGSTGFNQLPEAVLSTYGGVLTDHLEISNSKEIRLTDAISGTANEHHSSFKASGQSQDINYTLPSTAPTDNQYLKCSAAGVLSWDTFTGTDIADLVSNDANNRILTATGTTNSFNAEANLTFDGSTLSVSGAITSTGNIEIINNAPGITFTDSNDSHQFYIQTDGDALNLVDATNSTTKLGISNTGHITLRGNVTINDGYLEVANANLYINENITHAGDGDTRIRFPAANEIAFEAGGNERLRVKSTGLTFLTVDDGSNARVDVSGTSSTVGRVVATTTGFAAFTNLQLRGSQIDFANASGVSGVFDASNRLGIGTTSPDRLIHGAGASPILKLDSTNNEAYVQFKTASPANELYVGIVDSDIILQSSGASSTGNEKLRIKPNGMVGINSASPSGTLSVFDPNGNNVSLVLVTTAANNFIQLADSSNSHSYIGKEGSQTSFYTANAAGSATEKIAYFNSNGLNLVAGKGVNFSPYDNTGTDPYGSDSNSLDDYEEGSFQPAITSTSTDPSQNTYAHQNGYYVKIGQLVHVRVDVEFASSGVSAGTGLAVLSNLPFINSNETRAYGVTMAVGFSPNWSNNGCPTGGYMEQNQYYSYLMPYNTNGQTFTQAADIGNGTRLIAGLTYITN